MRCRRFVSAMLALCMGCAVFGTLPEMPVALTVYAAETQPAQPDEMAPDAEETAPPETVTAAVSVTTETTVTTAETEPETTEMSARLPEQTTTTTVSQSSASSSTKKTTASSKSTTTTTTTAVSQSSASSSTKKTTSTSPKTTAAQSGTVTTATEAVSAQSSESTTATAPEPMLIPMLKSSFPGGQTELKLWLRNNPGVEALGVSILLPEVLTPHQQDGRSIEVTEGALTGRMLCLYNTEQNCIALDYISSGSTPTEPLLCSIPLDISEDAVIGQSYFGELTLDCIDLADEAELAEGTVQIRFVPSEPLRRTLPETLSMKEQDETVQLQLSPEPPAGSCTFESSDPEVVSVDENGVLTALRNGPAVVTVRCETLVYQCRVAVLITRSILPNKAVLTGEREKKKFSLSPAPHSSVVWQSTDESVAVVDQDGNVTAMENGTAEIIASCEGYSYRRTVTVQIPAMLSFTQITAAGIGDRIQLKVLHAKPDAVYTWESSAPEIASADENGLVTFHGYGSAEICAVCGEERLVCTAENPEYLPGDVDGDRQITAYDATLALIGFNDIMLGFAAEERMLSPLQEQIGDVDGDGELTAFDATCILIYSSLVNAGFDDVSWEDILPSASAE